MVIGHLAARRSVVATTPAANQVAEATGRVVRLLLPEAGRDWTAPAGGLEWTCWETAAHIANDLASYAAQLAGLAQDRYLKFDIVIRTDASPAELLAVVDACGRLLSEAVAAAPATARAWHWGPTDRTGFAAMGVGELLLHAYDIACGLGLDWRPPPELAEFVLTRMFADLPIDDPISTLLWATGRGDLPGRAAVEHWVWHAALS